MKFLWIINRNKYNKIHSYSHNNKIKNCNLIIKFKSINNQISHNKNKYYKYKLKINKRAKKIKIYKKIKIKYFHKKKMNSRYNFVKMNNNH